MVTFITQGIHERKLNILEVVTRAAIDSTFSKGDTSFVTPGIFLTLVGFPITFCSGYRAGSEGESSQYDTDGKKK